MKKFFIALAVISVLASAVSCEYDAPNINFTTTVTNDYSEVVQAIEDNTLTLAEKLKIINDALDNQTLTITQQADILKKAYENGVIKYEELFKMLLDRLVEIKDSTEAKLDAIKGALETENEDMKTKLDAINKAVNQGVVDINAKQDLILTALNSLFIDSPKTNCWKLAMTMCWFSQPSGTVISKTMRWYEPLWN